MMEFEQDNEEQISEEERLLRKQCLRVMEKTCQNCLFSKNKLVDDRRKAEILEQCEEDQTIFICHEASELGKAICCRTFWELYKSRLWTLRVAQKVEEDNPGSIRFVLPEK